MKIQRIHHVAYRCRDARETVEWYREHLGMDFVLAIAEDHVPSTHEPDPYMHVFLDAGGGNVLAFFELPSSPAMGRDPNTPPWVQHIAFKVDDIEAALAELKAKGVRLIDEKPRYGAGGAKIAFLHPKATNGVLIELCQKG